MLVIQVARAQASAKRIQEVLESKPKIHNKPGALHDFSPAGEVAFEHVTFSYNQDNFLFADTVMANIRSRGLPSFPHWPSMYRTSERITPYVLCLCDLLPDRLPALELTHV